MGICWPSSTLAEVYPKKKTARSGGVLGGEMYIYKHSSKNENSGPVGFDGKFPHAHLVNTGCRFSVPYPLSK